MAAAAAAAALAAGIPAATVSAASRARPPSETAADCGRLVHRPATGGAGAETADTSASRDTQARCCSGRRRCGRSASRGSLGG